jgi:hypothetical protein
MEVTHLIKLLNAKNEELEVANRELRKTNKDLEERIKALENPEFFIQKLITVDYATNEIVDSEDVKIQAKVTLSQYRPTGV